MLDCDAIYERLAGLGIGFFTGVPDSLLGPLCACIAHRAPDHLVAANEGNALALAVGYHVGTGGTGLVYLQNSGHGNLVNPLLSLADPTVYGVPVVILMGWRGRPGGPRDAVQHHAQGHSTEALLAATGTPYRELPDQPAEAEAVLTSVVSLARRERRPVVILVPEGRFAPWTTPSPPAEEPTMNREAALIRLLDACPDDALVVTTTGKISREWDEARRARGHGPESDFLVVGSMGHASSIALGLARTRHDRPVWCLDGDGAALMHLGAMALLGARGPGNLTHVVLNNGAHDSVGGQPTVGLEVDLPGIARACGYAWIELAIDRPALDQAADRLGTRIGPGFLEVRVARGARPDLGRPEIPPRERLRRLRRHLVGPEALP